MLIVIVLVTLEWPKLMVLGSGKCKTGVDYDW